MMTSTAFRASACLTALMLAPAARADVTAQQVWDAWQASMTEFAASAQITTGAVDTSGDTVTVTDFALNNDVDGDTVSMSIPQIVFTGAGDGTVDITLSDTVPLEFTTDTDVKVAMSVKQTGTVITASGTPDALRYDVSADQYVLSVDKLTGTDGPIDGDMQVTLNAVAGTSAIVTGDLRESSYDLTISTVDLLVDITSPDDTSVLISGKIDGIASAGTSSAPMDLDYSDPAAMVGGDYVAKGSYTSGPSAYIIAVNGTTTLNGTAANGPGTMSYSVGPDGLSYEITASDVSADLTSSEMPFPFRFSATSYGFALTSPLVPTDAPVPFKLALDLSSLTVNEEIWAMVDPMATLPRDPATIKVDISGAAQLDVALMDAEQAQALAMKPGFPGKIENLSLNALTIDAVGLNVDGSGEFTFDNADTTTFPGMPRPDGMVTINVTGANALIDHLIAMGLVPAGQAMMPRMMLGMFAKPVGEDALQSVIEVKDGQVLANGQRIR